MTNPAAKVPMLWCLVLAAVCLAGIVGTVFA